MVNEQLCNLDEEDKDVCLMENTRRWSCKMGEQRQVELTSSPWVGKGGRRKRQLMEGRRSIGSAQAVGALACLFASGTRMSDPLNYHGTIGRTEDFEARGKLKQRCRVIQIFF